jgi:FkbM family methyltransferase
MSQDDNHISIGTTALALPHDHKLPIYLNRFPHYDFLYWNILGAIIAENTLERGGLIDIGANIGDSAAHFRRYSSGPIIAIEPSPHYFQYLTQNTDKFTDVTLKNGVVSTKEVGAGLEVQFTGGTGSSTIDKNSKFEGHIIFADALIEQAPKTYMLKSDTDGFDGHLILALVKEMSLQNKFANIITFEGPSKAQGLLREVDSHVAAIKRLISEGYVVQILSNLGKPIAFVGCNFEAFEWHIKVWLNLLAERDFTCPYYDFICVKSDLNIETLKFESESYSRMLANAFTSHGDGV